MRGMGVCGVLSCVVRGCLLSPYFSVRGRHGMLVVRGHCATANQGSESMTLEQSRGL